MRFTLKTLTTLLFIGAVLLTACGGDDDSDQATVTEDRDGEQVADDPSAEDTSGGGDVDGAAVATSAAAQGGDVVIEFISESTDFEVSTGSDVLGCDGGTWANTDTSPYDGSMGEATNDGPGADIDQYTYELACGSGSRTGTLTIVTAPGLNVNDMERLTGPWTISSGTGDFDGIGGGGEMELVFLVDPENEEAGPMGIESETYTGTVDGLPS